MASSSRLRLGARIARGGMAEVFAARLIGPAGFEKDVAVKRVLPRYADDPVFLQRFLAEARLAARLSHPNIVQIFELGDDGRDHYIVMEAVRGATLRQLLVRLAEQGERMPRSIALFIARSICAGLAHAHELPGPDGRPLQVIHRDVSPQNVLVGHEGSVKLIDFGIAQARDSERLTRVGRPLGKPHYMAPEQLASLPLDPRADLFAVGVLLHEMLTGERPFDDDNDVDIADHIARGERRPLRQVAPDLEAPLVALVDRALATRREDRPESARALGALIAEAANRTGHRADAHDLEGLLARLLPEDVARPWPVDDERVDEGEHTRTSVGEPRGREITLSSEGGPVASTDEVTSSLSTSPPPSSRRFLWLAAGLVTLTGVVGVGLGLWVSSPRPAGGPAASIDAGPPPGVVDAGARVDVVDVVEPAGADAGTVEPAIASVDAGVGSAADAGVDAPEPVEPEDDGVDAGPTSRPPRQRDRPRDRPRPAARSGQLIVETRPWSEVQLDGRPLGVTPLQQTVRAGRHRLTLTNPGLGLSRELTIVVDDIDPTVVRVDLRAP